MMSGLLLLRALRPALPAAAVRRLRTAAPRPAFAKELFVGTLRKVRGPPRRSARGPAGREGGGGPPVQRSLRPAAPQGRVRAVPPPAPSHGGAGGSRCFSGYRRRWGGGVSPFPGRQRSAGPNRGLAPAARYRR